MAMYMAHCIYGYYGNDVPVVVTGRLEHQPYAQAGYIEYEDGWIALISYESEIFRFRVKNGVREISFDWSQASPSYSNTTAKHVGSFCKQFLPDLCYHDIKKMYSEFYQG